MENPNSVTVFIFEVYSNKSTSRIQTVSFLCSIFSLIYLVHSDKSSKFAGVNQEVKPNKE